MFSGVFIAAEVYGVGDRGKEIPQQFMYMEVFLSTIVKTVSFIDKALFK